MNAGVVNENHFCQKVTYFPTITLAYRINLSLR
jgi:hypothetical protein